MTRAVRGISLVRTGLVAIAAMFALTLAGLGAQQHTSKPFAGAKVNGGTVTHSVQGGKHMLTLSDDFQIPDTPDPHWQLVDSKGTVYMMHKLSIKENKVNKSIMVPAYVKDVAKVQIWCAFAETLLGEASFDSPLTTN